jgi:hypothetical protein
MVKKEEPLGGNSRGPSWNESEETSSFLKRRIAEESEIVELCKAFIISNN